MEITIGRPYGITGGLNGIMHVKGSLLFLLPLELANLGHTNRSESASGVWTHVVTAGLIGASVSMQGGACTQPPAAWRERGGVHVLTEFHGNLICVGANCQQISKLAVSCRQEDVLCETS